MVERTRRVVYLNDGELAVISRAGGYEVKTLDNVRLVHEVHMMMMPLVMTTHAHHDHD